jgi:hypothetical protein
MIGRGGGACFAKGGIDVDIAFGAKARREQGRGKGVARNIYNRDIPYKAMHKKNDDLIVKN